MPNEPITHISRGDIPWRKAHLTECGLSLADGHPVISRAEFADKLKREGQQRAAFSTCMTCWQTTTRYDRHVVDMGVIEAVEREISWARGGHRKSERARLESELAAIGQLVADHRAEFDENCQVQSLSLDNDLNRKRKESAQ